MKLCNWAWLRRSPASWLLLGLALRATSFVGGRVKPRSWALRSVQTLSEVRTLNEARFALLSEPFRRGERLENGSKRVEPSSFPAFWGPEVLGEPPMARERALPLGLSGLRSGRAAGDHCGSALRGLPMRLVALFFACFFHCFTLFFIAFDCFPWLSGHLHHLLVLHVR